ncbi:hypothetical protein EON65_54290, partial [archaeon]
MHRILHIGGDGTFTVKSTSGDTQLGGDDWDERVIDELVNTFEQETSIAMDRLLAALVP